MKRAHVARHNGVSGNCSVHQACQRCSVWRATPNSAPRRTPVGVAAVRDPDTSTTASARYTRRPRKRTDSEVDRCAAHRTAKAQAR